MVYCNWTRVLDLNFSKLKAYSILRGEIFFCKKDKNTSLYCAFLIWDNLNIFCISMSGIRLQLCLTLLEINFLLHQIFISLEILKSISKQTFKN